MKYINEYREENLTRILVGQLKNIVTQPWTIMEICGGQTHAIIKSGLDQLLPLEITLIHGPGCPVCVTPLELIDKAIALASRPDVIFVSYGDMLRVPGSERDLFSVKAAGGDIRIVYSPLDSLKIAIQNPDKTIVFFGIGFETTAPANAMTVVQAKNQDISNFALLVSHVTVPPAISALLETSQVNVDGFLAAGHVNTVMGYWEYEPLAQKYGRHGFEGSRPLERSSPSTSTCSAGEGVRRSDPAIARMTSPRLRLLCETCCHAANVQYFARFNQSLG